MRLLPPSNIPARVVTVSVDLSASDGNGRTSLPHDKDVERLLEVFRQHGVIATWGLPEPAGPVAEQVRASDPQHEVAVSARPSEAGGTQSEVRDVIRRLDDVAPAAPVVATLVVRGPLPSSDNSLLARQGIRAIASDRPVVGRRRDNAVITVRYGLWHLPSAVNVGGANSSTGDWRMRRKIDRTMAAGGLFHLAVDGFQVLQSGATLRQLERLLSHVAHHDRRGDLTVRTLADVTESFARQAARSARSILRMQVRSAKAA